MSVSTKGLAYDLCSCSYPVAHGGRPFFHLTAPSARMSPIVHRLSTIDFQSICFILLLCPPSLVWGHERPGRVVGAGMDVKNGVLLLFVVWHGRISRLSRNGEGRRRKKLARVNTRHRELKSWTAVSGSTGSTGSTSSAVSLVCSFLFSFFLSFPFWKWHPSPNRTFHSKVQHRPSCLTETRRPRSCLSRQTNEERCEKQRRGERTIQKNRELRERPAPYRRCLTGSFAGFFFFSFVVSHFCSLSPPFIFSFFSDSF